MGLTGNDEVFKLVSLLFSRSLHLSILHGRTSILPLTALSSSQPSSSAHVTTTPAEISFQRINSIHLVFSLLKLCLNAAFGTKQSEVNNYNILTQTAVFSLKMQKEIHNNNLFCIVQRWERDRQTEEKGKKCALPRVCSRRISAHGVTPVMTQPSGASRDLQCNSLYISWQIQRDSHTPQPPPSQIPNTHSQESENCFSQEGILQYTFRLKAINPHTRAEKCTYQSLQDSDLKWLIMWWLFARFAADFAPFLFIVLLWIYTQMYTN